MRTYGKINGVWTKVETDANGFDDNVWLTTLMQNLKGQVNESPFFSSDGIPAQACAVSMIFPDFYVNQIQQKFAPHFQYLQITKAAGATPTYNIKVITHSGAVLPVTMAV